MSQDYNTSKRNQSPRVTLFAPAGPPGPERLKEGRALVEQEFAQVSLKWDTGVMEHAAPFPWLYDDDIRQAASFNALMRDSDATFAWAVRGGYGILRWINRVDWAGISDKSPVVTGFSDVTVLHAALNSRGIKTIHGPMLCTLANTDRESRRALLECFIKWNFPVLNARQCICKGHEVRGRLAGGNLCCLSHLIGTAWEPDWSGILFLEDVNEPLYRIDRMLTHLLQSNRLSDVRGIAMGEFTQCGDSEALLLELFSDRFKALGVPVISGVPAGHGTDNMPLLFGAEYLLDPAECRLVPLNTEGYCPGHRPTK